jgi:hypothetical protein
MLGIYIRNKNQSLMMGIEPSSPQVVRLDLRLSI